jgi:hypothetical protein
MQVVDGGAQGIPIEGINLIDDTGENLLVVMKDAKLFKNLVVGEDGMFCE